MTVKEVKKELSMYRILNDDINDIEEKIDRLYYELGGVKGLRYDIQKGNGAIDNMKWFKLAPKIERLEQELTRLTLQVEHIEMILNAIEDKKLKDAIVDVYIDGKGLRVVANRFNCSHTALQDMIDEELSRIIKLLYG